MEIQLLLLFYKRLYYAYLSFLFDAQVVIAGAERFNIYFCFGFGSIKRTAEHLLAC